MSATRETIICSSEDGDWYALAGELTRDEAIAALAELDMVVSDDESATELPDGSWPYALRRGHIVLLAGDELEAELGKHAEHEEYWIECPADRAAAREVWIASDQ